MVMVEVLCTNGHRVKVNCTPNTSLRQVLEEACNRKSLLPADDFGLKYNGKVVDLSLPFRFSGLINNSKLEMFAAEKTQVSQVVVAVQLETGDRLQVTVDPSVTLTDVLKKASDAFPEQASQFCASSHPNLTPVVVYFREEIVGTFCLDNTTLKTLGLTHGRTILRFFWRKDAEGQAEKAEESLRARLRANTAKAKPASASSASAPSDSAPATVPSQAVAPSPQMSAPVKENDSGFSWFKDPPAPLPTVQPVVVSQFGVNPFSQPPAPVDSQLMNFKFPEETAGQQLYHNELSSKTEDEFLECDRRPVWFSSCPNSRPVSDPSAQDALPDSFFDVTEEDVKKMMNDLKKRVVEEREMPLMTQSMRLAAKEAKYSKYNRAVIRFVFPDGVILQALFRPRETVHHLYKFVKKEISNTKFRLYTTPPRKILTDGADSLIEANLVPLTRVYIGGDVEIGAAVTRPDVHVSSEQEAKEVVIDCLKTIVTENPDSSQSSVPSAARRSDAQRPPSVHSSGQENKKVPKWFKVGR